jgi:hypothetical protein
MSLFDAWLQEAAEMKHVDPETSVPERLVHSEADAHWLDPAMTGNPSRIGVLVEVPAKTMEFYAQEIPAQTAGDYNDSDLPVRMLLVENSRLLGALGLNQRESAGEISYAEHTEQAGRP